MLSAVSRGGCARNYIRSSIIVQDTTRISSILENFPARCDCAARTFAYARARYSKNGLCSKSRVFISDRNCSRIVSLPRSTQLWLFRFAPRISTEVLIKAVGCFNTTPGASRFMRVSGLVFQDLCLLNDNRFPQFRVSVERQNLSDSARNRN